MRKSSFYPRLAAQNIRRNGQFYLPYLLSSLATTAMFYILCFLTLNQGLWSMRGAEALYTILVLGCVVVGLFSAIFLFYTNSFLMKRRQKELGLYSILGMGKGNITGILFFETMITTLVTLIGGLAVGILLSKLMLLLLCSLVSFPVPFGFEISLKAVSWTVLLFLGIFLLILLSNFVRIRLSNPISLLRGAKVGEKEPKTRWLLALLGLISLGCGYYIAIVTESPLQAILLFFVAVLLVIFGTYLLFTATSIVLLKALKKRTGYYYTTRHFIPVSGMLYRMKQNAVGLANICILSTMVLVMVSGTVCLYLGTEDAVNNAYPTEILVSVSNPTGSARELLRETAREAVTDSGLELEHETDLLYFSFVCRLEGGTLSSVDFYSSENDNADFFLIPASEYLALSGDAEGPAEGQLWLYAHPDNRASLGDDTALFGETLSITRRLQGYPNISQRDAIIANHFCAVVSDAAFDRMVQYNAREIEGFLPDWYYGFDLTGTDAQKAAAYTAIGDAVYGVELSGENSPGNYYSCNVTSRDEWAGSVYSMNGGFLFLGLFLGAVFLIAAALIIYYKQLSEGYDDKERFVIMQQVGLSRPEIKSAIRSQILVVFFLPLGMAVVHIAFAFKMITKLLLVFNLTNLTLFALCVLGTVGIFALIYGLVYLLTAKVYYRIVR